MKKGIVLVVFGREYDRIGAACATISRKYTDLPFHILTNLHPSKRSPLWKAVGDVTFRIFDWPIEKNRVAKTSLPELTPFDFSLYMDVDCVIRNKGVEEIFFCLEEMNYDLILNRFDFWERGDKVLKIYRRAMKMFNVGLPLTIWNGGLAAFRKNKSTADFFREWQSGWEAFGRGREMPVLACVVKNQLGNFPIGIFPPRFFAPDALNEDAVVQHDCPGFIEKFGLPSWERWVPFDTDPTDFTWVEL